MKAPVLRALLDRCLEKARDTRQLAVLQRQLREQMGEAAVAAALRERVNALVVAGTPMFTQHSRQLADLLAKNRLPAISIWAVFPEAGGFMAYGPSLTDEFRRAAIYVDKILKGANPGDLPIEQPTKYNLAINLKTAKSLGLTIPRALLLRADQVIE